jgi:hypothetical protein
VTQGKVKRITWTRMTNPTLFGYYDDGEYHVDEYGADIPSVHEAGNLCIRKLSR